MVQIILVRVLIFLYYSGYRLQLNSNLLCRLRKFKKNLQQVDIIFKDLLGCIFHKISITENVMGRIFSFLFVFFYSTVGYATAKPSEHTIQAQIPYEKIIVNDGGIFLISSTLGEILLSNLQYDEGGYYTTCHLEYICTDCEKSQSQFSGVCEHCHSNEIEILDIQNENDSQYLTTYDIVCEILNDPLFAYGEYFCGTAAITGDIDTDGNRSLSLKVEDSTDDGNVSWGVEGAIEQNEEGETSGKAGFTVKVGF